MSPRVQQPPSHNGLASYRSGPAEIASRSGEVDSSRDAETSSPERGRLAVHLFGRMRVRSNGHELPGLTCAKAQELLAFLLLHRDRAHRREAVADQLWGEAACADPRKTFRQALWRLQSALAGWPTLVESLGGDWIQLSSAARPWVDVHRFEAAYEDLQDASRAAPSAPVWRRAEEALRLYTDDLLEGSSWSWCVGQRERLRELFFLMADEVLDRYRAAGEYAPGIRLGLEVLRRDPSRETTYRHLMQLHALAGDRTAALRLYERCAEALRDEFGVAPGQLTWELFESIRGDAMGGDTVSIRTAARDLSPPVSGVLRGLDQLRALLSEVRREVHVEIETIEKVFEIRK